jgi:flavin-binding protein dodecin
MSTKKVIEILSESPDGWEQAAQQALTDAQKSVRGVSSIYIKEMEAKVEGDRITRYRINAKVTFEVEGT